MRRHCKICGKHYTPRQHNQFTCGSFECKSERNRHNVYSRIAIQRHGSWDAFKNQIHERKRKQYMRRLRAICLYMDGKSMREIGKVLDITHQRVSQILNCYELIWREIEPGEWAFIMREQKTKNALRF